MSFSCERIAGVEYYYALDQDAAQAGGWSPHDVDADGNARDYATYSGPDNGAGDNRGTWINFERRAGTIAPPALLSRGKYAGLLDGCIDEAIVDGTHLRALSRGVDPRTLAYTESGRVVPTSGQRIYNARPHEDINQDPGGYDLQMAPPKDVSVIGLTGSLQEREAFTRAHQQAYVAALEWAWSQGYFVTRKAHRKTGRVQYVPVAEAAMATFTHFTSRENDPQIHNHTAIMKMSLDRDGNVCALDNYLLKKHGGAIAAMYRTELVSRLKRVMSCKFVRDGEHREGRNFRIEGFPNQIRALFSKRRAQVLEELGKAVRILGVSLETASNRAAAQVASYNSRANKEFIPIEHLVENWRTELRLHRWPRESLVEALKAVPGPEASSQAGNGAGRRHRLGELVMAEIARIVTDHAIIDNARLLRAAGEALQTEAESAREIMAVLDELKQANLLTKVHDGRDGPRWTTQVIADKEFGMLTVAAKRRNEQEWVSQEIVEATVAERMTTGEQAAAVRHLLNRDGISNVQGLGGADKVVITQAVVHVWKTANPEAAVWGAAPSPETTRDLATAAGLGSENVMTVPQFIQACDRGQIALKNGDLFILDQAGRVNLHDYARLIDITGQQGTKFVAQGKLLPDFPFGAGAPFYALQRVLGVAKLGEIRPFGRTGEESEWMRAASQDLARGGGGDPGGPAAMQRAVEAYDRAGKVAWASAADMARAKAVEMYLQHRAERPNESGVIITEWNSDARDLSNGIRARLIERGGLSELAVRSVVIPRGPKGAAGELELRAGDAVIFGETVELAEVTIRDGDTGRISAIRENPSRPMDTMLTIQLTKGRQFTARLSELVGHREVGQLAIPKMQHFYALTGRSLQDASVDYAIDLHLNLRGANETYVGMTRHRKELDIVVACDRIEDELAFQDTVSMPKGKSRGIRKAGSEDRVREWFYARIARPDRVSNVSDFLDDNEFHRRLAVQPPQAARAAATSAEQLMVWLAERQTAPQGYRAQWKRSSLKRRHRLIDDPVVELAHAVRESSPLAKAHSSKLAPTSRVLSEPAQTLVRRMSAARQDLQGKPQTGQPGSRTKVQLRDDNAGSGRSAGSVQDWFKRLSRHPSQWLVEERGIAPGLIQRFSADLRSEQNPNGVNLNGAAFAHRDVDGVIRAVMRQGPGNGVESFKSVVPQTTSYLFQAGDTREPKKIYLGNTAIDILSLYQLDKQPVRTLLMASDGVPGGEALRIVENRAAKHKGLEWHLGCSNDIAGESFMIAAREAIRKANPDAQIVERRPELQFENWSDSLRGLNREEAARLKDEAKVRPKEDAKREAERQVERVGQAQRVQPRRNQPRTR